jgi:hypothetical protein
MRRSILSLVPLAAFGLLVLGCAGPERMGRHERAESPAGQTIQCQKCYGEAQAALPGTARTHWPRKRMQYREIKHHVCPACKSDVVLYEEDGVPMIKCSGCAPEGVACDLCRPPQNPATTGQ